MCSYYLLQDASDIWFLFVSRLVIGGLKLTEASLVLQLHILLSFLFCLDDAGVTFVQQLVDLVWVYVLSGVVFYYFEQASRV